MAVEPVDMSIAKGSSVASAAAFLEGALAAGFAGLAAPVADDGDVALLGADFAGGVFAAAGFAGVVLGGINPFALAGSIGDPQKGQTSASSSSTEAWQEGQRLSMILDDRRRPGDRRGAWRRRERIRDRKSAAASAV
jgi:hypothetical protein